MVHRVQKVVKLISDGKRQNEIKSACIEENLFGAVNAYRSKRIAGYLTNRVAALDAKEVQLFMESDPATQKLLNLIAILRTDRLFFEFLFDVYREKIILGITIMETRDANIFFNNKEVQSAEVEAWKDTTKRKLRSCYFNFMSMQICLRRMEKRAELRRRFWTSPWSGISRAKGDSAMIKAITGVS